MNRWMPICVVLPICCALGCLHSVQAVNEAFPYEVKGILLPGMRAQEAEQILINQNYLRTHTTSDRMIVKDNDGDEPMRIEIRNRKCIRYMRVKGGSVVSTAFLVVLVVDDQECIKEVYSWAEHTGP